MTAFILNSSTGRIVREFASIDLAESWLESADYEMPRLAGLLDVWVIGDCGWRDANLPSDIAKRLMRRETVAA